MTHPAPRIYLASRSPRRRELLQQIHVAFDVLMFREGDRADDDVCEDPLPGENPLDYVQRVSLTKAEAGVRRIAHRHLRPQPVLSADTTLDLDGRIIGKPASPADAEGILHSLSGRTHRVLTAVTLAAGHRSEQRVSISEVRFRVLDDAEIRHYVSSGEPMDKAGAYGIQGYAGIFVEEIRGSYTGIMGLPLFETALLLRDFGHPV